MGAGGVYRIDLAGHYSPVYSFEEATDPFRPSGKLTEVEGSLYGVTTASGLGTTIYSLDGSDANVAYQFPYTRGQMAVFLVKTFGLD